MLLTVINSHSFYFKPIHSNRLSNMVQFGNVSSNSSFSSESPGLLKDYYIKYSCLQVRSQKFET